MRWSARKRSGAQWSDRCPDVGPWTEAVKRSLITLKALTYAPTGGIVAAATTSLPERLGGVRNWDYRYCWLRDATFTLLAFMNLGYYDEARAWRDWLIRAVAGSPSQVQIMYGVGGERWLPELIVPWLPGYENSSPVRIGNDASQATAARRLRRDRRRDVSGAQGRHGAVRTRPSLAAGCIGVSGNGLAATGRRYLGGARRAAALRPFEGHGLGRIRSRGERAGISSIPRVQGSGGARSPTKSMPKSVSAVSTATLTASCRPTAPSGSTQVCC